MSLIISTSNGSVEVFSGYFMTILIIPVLFTAFVLLLYIFFQRFLKSQRGFFLCRCAVRLTHYSLSINRVGFFLSINREKNRLFPSDFMRTCF